MDQSVINVREMQEPDMESIINYWLKSETSFLESMGVDVKKIPTKEQMKEMLFGQLNTPLKQKRSYCIIWELDSKPIGHSNTNPTTFGEEGFMHLHIWDAVSRKKGLGLEFIKRTLPYFFNNLQLQRLFSEPYALNPAPNKTLEKAGFELEKEYITTPGSLNFEQPVKRWVLTREKFMQIYQ